jgi:carbamoyl-phosphate synthase large subunit
MTTILFTSVGRRVELMRAFRAAYERVGDEGHIVAVDVDRLAPALHTLGPRDNTYVVPRTVSKEYIPALIDICRKDRVDLVIPLIDPDIVVLARHADEFRAAGARAAVPDQQAAEIAADKWLTGTFFRDLGLPVPHTKRAADELTGELPVVVKPRFGSAAHDVYVARSPEDLAYSRAHVSDPLFQEYLPGPEITTDVIVGLGGELLATVSRQRIAVRAGEVAKGKTIHDRRIAEACARIAAALGVRCPITVQCIFKDGTPYFTEINARLGGGLPLAIAAGVDVPALILRSARGETSAPIPWDGYRAGLYLTRFDDSFFLDEGFQRV